MNAFISKLLRLRKAATDGPMEYSPRPDDKPDEAPGSVISGAATGRATAVVVAPRYSREQFALDANFIVLAYNSAHLLVDHLRASEALIEQIDYLFPPGFRHALYREVEQLRKTMAALETFVK